MHSYLGFLHWQVCSRGLACPVTAGAYCWLNGDMGGHTPVAVLQSLVVLQVLAAEPWCAPSADVQTLCLELGLHKNEQALMGRWWEGPDLILFVDRAHDGRSWRMGGFSEFVGAKLQIAMSLRSKSQQLVELQPLVQGVRVAIRLPEESEGVQGPEDSGTEQAPPPASTQRKKATADVVTNACPG